MSRRPIVAVSALPPMFDPVAPLLTEAGCDVRPVPTGPGFTWAPDAIEAHIAHADALVGIFPGGASVGPDVLDGAPRLRAVVSPIIGTETIDVAACTERGIIVGFGATPENYLGVAEANVMLIAALRKQLAAKTAAARDGSWRPAGGVGNMVRGATVGIIGFGAIGRATAARLQGWECTVVGHDPHVEPRVFAAAGVTSLPLAELLATSDIVLLAVTLTAQTRGLIGAAELNAMKPGAYLINTARGGLVDEAALLDALDSGRLGGAALDTWLEEGPGTASPLRDHPRVIATGHNVGHSAELYTGHPVAARDNTVRALRSELPLYVRNPEAEPAWRARLARLGAPGFALPLLQGDR